jgi:DNA mismatch repair ATPase MutL
LENSLDAGAKTSSSMSGSGQRLVEVSDDGWTNQDLVLAIERHATSNYISADDLFKLRL